MEFQKLNAEIRTGRKKGAARKLRRAGSVPAICYGLKSEAMALTVDPTVLSDALSGPLGRNTVLEMSISGDGAPSESVLVMLQSTQYHPVEREMLHADFIRIDKDKKVSVDVPLTTTGKAVGVQVGGVLTQIYRAIPVICPIDAIPTELSLEVSALDMGDLLKVSDLTLPEGVETTLDSNLTIVNVIASSKATSEADEEEGEEGEDAVEGEETPEDDEEKKAE